jgi:hypothetical protein
MRSLPVMLSTVLRSNQKIVTFAIELYAVRARATSSEVSIALTGLYMCQLTQRQRQRQTGRTTV